MEPAPFYSELADGPGTGGAWFVQANDGVRIRVGGWTSKGDTGGTIFLLLGTFGYIERYGRVADFFATQQFSTFIADWRGQGLSDRLSSDPRAGHILSFKDYQRDLQAMVATAEKLHLPKPYHLLGVSMGAAIGLRALIEGLPFVSAAFIAPMWGIKMTRLERMAAWPVSFAAKTIGLGHRYIPGESSDLYVTTTPFAENNLTNNKEMYDFWVHQAREAPELQIGGPTFSWLYEGLRECRGLARLSSPSVRCLTYCGEQDSLVDNAAISERMAKWRGGELRLVANGKHDVLTESFEDKGSPLAEIAAFFRQIRETV